MSVKFPRQLRRLFNAPTSFQQLVSPGQKPTLGRQKPKGRSRTALPRLDEVTGFGKNPGGLKMLEYVPKGREGKMPLVVVLHGCSQDARDFDRGSGWTELARKHGFAVLYPEQTRLNNSNLCFNWFRPSLVKRDRGEVGSVREMIASVAARHAIDEKRVFVMGLSAGGAMASALLTTYPELFAGGAIVGGLPFGAARDAMGALSAMQTSPARSPDEWADLVREVSPDARRFPSISIWHGTADRVVSFSNAEASLSQWLALHGRDPAKETSTPFDGGSRRRWSSKAGGTVELVALDDFGHGVPVGSRASGKGGAAGQNVMLPSQLSLVDSLVETWKLHKR
jgi:poly(hydroxyalkanoate) depolymerase family esterase